MKKTVVQYKGKAITKNQEFIVDIEDLTAEGAGVAKLDGYTLFIKDALIGDKVRVSIMKTKKNYGYARLVEILEPSKDRIEPACPMARKCGGCQLQHLRYEAQLSYKQDKIASCLERIGGFSNLPMEPIMGMDEPYYYRNKAQFPVGRDKNGALVTGFYAGHSHLSLIHI